MKPRTALLIGLVILVYFSLSLYHGYQLKKIPEVASQVKGRSQAAGEKNNSTWVQVSTLPENGKRTAAQTVGPNGEHRRAVHVHEARTLALAQQRITALEQALANREVRIADLQQQLKKNNKQIARQRAALRQAAQRSDISSQNTGDSNSLITAQQAKIQQLETILLKKEQLLKQTSATVSELEGKLAKLTGKLRKYRAASLQSERLMAMLRAKTNDLAKAKARIKALAARLKHTGVNLAAAERTIARLQQSLARAQARLTNATTRLAVMQEERNQARLKAEAMLRYGQEQNRRLAPSRQEIETLNIRLRSASGALRRAADRIKKLQDLNRKTAGQLAAAQKKAAGQRRTVEQLNKLVRKK